MTKVQFITVILYKTKVRTAQLLNQGVFFNFTHHLPIVHPLSKVMRYHWCGERLSLSKGEVGGISLSDI